MFDNSVTIGNTAFSGKKSKEAPTKFDAEFMRFPTKKRSKTGGDFAFRYFFIKSGCFNNMKIFLRR